MNEVQEAIAIAVRFGGISGAHHKAWVIDQMVRALTGCQPIASPATEIAPFGGYGESEHYTELVARAKVGYDGPDTYSWDTGTAP
jgi:hypothetical protein